MAEQDDNKPYLTQPTTNVDLARRYAEEEAGGKKAEVVNPTPYAVEDNDVTAYAGVSEEYATYADDRQAPMLADGGPEEEAERRLRGAEAGLTTKLPQADRTFVKPDKEVVAGVAPSAKAVGGLTEVGPMSTGVTANEPVPVTVQPKFEDSDFASADSDKPEPASDVTVTPVAETEPDGTSREEANEAAATGEAVTTEAEPKKAAPKKAPSGGASGDNDKQGAGKE